MREIWKDIKGFEGLYRVSNLGRVLGVKRGRVLAPVKKPGETPRAMLCKGGEYQSKSIANLVCEAFKGDRPPGAIAAHKDGDVDNNRTRNLFWAHEDTWVAGSHGRSPFPVAFTLVSPKGATVEGKGLLAFCREHGLDPAGIGQVARGNRLSYRGWTTPGSPPSWLKRTQQRALAC